MKKEWLVGRQLLHEILGQADAVGVKTLICSRYSLVAAEALRVNIGSKSAISLQWRLVDPKFQTEGVAPHQPFFFSELG